jgi:hypothetical protein
MGRNMEASRWLVHYPSVEKGFSTRRTTKARLAGGMETIRRYSFRPDAQGLLSSSTFLLYFPPLLEVFGCQISVVATVFDFEQKADMHKSHDPIL